MTQDEVEQLERLEGLFVGQLSHDEIRLLDRARAEGIANVSYDGPAGFFGLSKVRLASRKLHSDVEK